MTLPAESIKNLLFSRQSNFTLATSANAGSSIEESSGESQRAILNPEEMMTFQWAVIAILLLAIANTFADAAVTPEEAARLKSELTPLGAARRNGFDDVAAWLVQRGAR